MTPPVAQDRLRSFFDRWQRLEEDKAAISDDLKELFAEAKDEGFDGKAVRAAFRKVAKLEGENSAAEQEHDDRVDLYVNAISRAHPRDAREADPRPKATTGDGKANQPHDVTPSDSGGHAANEGGDHEVAGEIGTDRLIEAGAVASPQLIEESRANPEEAGSEEESAPADDAGSRPSRGGGTPAPNSEMPVGAFTDSAVGVGTSDGCAQAGNDVREKEGVHGPDATAARQSQQPATSSPQVEAGADAARRVSAPASDHDSFDPGLPPGLDRRHELRRAG